jgi:hypothetical protein
MIPRLTIALAAAALLLAASPASAEPRGFRFDEGRGVRECVDLDGRVDPAGENRGELRDGPGEENPLLGRLAAGSRAGRHVPVRIVGSFDGWLEVGGPAVDAAIAGTQPGEDGLYRTTAWILGRGVAADVDSTTAYGSPRAGSQPLIQTLDGRPLAAHARVVDIVACDGPWLFGRWELRRPERLRFIPELQIWSDPIRIEAWAPRRPTFPERGDERRAIGDWLVESYGEEELSRAVRVGRVFGPFEVHHSVSFWHGNRGPYFSVEARRDGTRCGGEDWRRDEASDVWRAETDVAAAARDVRARLAAALETCGAMPEEGAAALAGFERAYAVAARWAELDRRHVLAVAEAIANPRTDLPH